MNSILENFKSIDATDLLYNYQSYNLERMNPTFYDVTKGDKMEMFETMMHHKYLHDKCMKIMITKHLEDVDVVEFLNEMINHYENLEEYEACSDLKIIQSKYESGIRS